MPAIQHILVTKKVAERRIFVKIQQFLNSEFLPVIFVIFATVMHYGSKKCIILTSVSTIVVIIMGTYL